MFGFTCGASGFTCGGGGAFVVTDAPGAGVFDDVGELGEEFFVGGGAVVWWVGDESVVCGVVAFEFGREVRSFRASEEGDFSGGEDVGR